MKIFYIHGANASPQSFTFLSNIISKDCEFADYSSSNGFFNNLRHMQDQIKDNDWFIVSHSLGGIYSAHLSSFLGTRLKGAVSLSTPYGGSEISDMMMFVHPFTRLFRDTGTRARPIVDAQQILRGKPKSNWTGVVTTSGRVPYLPGHNDGVVSVNSQMALSDCMDIVHLDCNHYEILQESTVADIVLSKLHSSV